MYGVKHIAKKVLSLLCAKHLDQCTKTLMRDNIVSFDVFDTLVIRECGEPKAVFDILEKKYNESCILNNNAIKNIALIREKCEQDIRRGRESEITLDEIYGRIAEEIGRDEAERLKKLEIEIELQQCRPNTEVVDLFNSIINDHTVFIISDMYLPKCVIKDILNKCNIKGYMELYVSSDNGLTKRSSSLFEYVISANGIDKSKMIHIGDHPLADYFVPRFRVGIKSFLYKR